MYINRRHTSFKISDTYLSFKFTAWRPTDDADAAGEAVGKISDRASLVTLVRAEKDGRYFIPSG